MEALYNILTVIGAGLGLGLMVAGIFTKIMWVIFLFNRMENINDKLEG